MVWVPSDSSTSPQGVLAYQDQSDRVVTRPRPTSPISTPRSRRRGRAGPEVDEHVDRTGAVHGALNTAQPWFQALVDAVLPAPHVGRPCAGTPADIHACSSRPSSEARVAKIPATRLRESRVTPGFVIDIRTIASASADRPGVYGRSSSTASGERPTVVAATVP